MYSEHTLNLAVARPGTSITNQYPVPYDARSGMYQPDSIATGGQEFSHHRNAQAPTYVQDCIATETGFASVEYIPHCANVKYGTTFLNYLRRCDIQEECPLQWDKSNVIDVTQHKEGTLMLMQDGNLVLATKTGFRTIQPNGIDADKAKGIESHNGRNIIYSDRDLYMSSREDAFEFTPRLRTQAQAYGIKFDIGIIQKVISSGDLLYVLGDRGGAVGQCSGDAYFPLTFHALAGFDGLPAEGCAEVDFVPTVFVVWSRSGLMRIEGRSATPVLPDVSMDIDDGRVVNIVRKDDTPPDSTFDPYDVVTQSDWNTRDSLAECLYTTLWTEDEEANRIPRVRNITARRTIISYGGDVEGVYSRVLVLDTDSSRFTVLHKDHTDVLQWDADRIILATPSGTVVTNTYKGEGRLMFSGLFRTSRRPIKIPLLTTKGRFNLDSYSDNTGCKPVQDKFSKIFCTIGTDLPSTNNARDLQRVLTSSGDLQYAGLIIGHYVDMLIPFSGFINVVKIRRS